MGITTRGKVTLGLITRYLDNPTPILRFFENAQGCGHRIDRFIVAYSHGVDEETVEMLRRVARVDVLRAPGDTALKERLLTGGLSLKDVDRLLGVPSWPCHNEVPYGAYRNTVLVHALLTGMDYLLFFDSDVQPRVLTGHRDGQSSWQEVDFVGRHLAHLTQPNVSATSSDYSGYYIIPPMSFEGLSELLVGVGKELALDYMDECEDHGCLNLGSGTPSQARPTTKVLGGNLGLNLDAPRRLAPFFSTTYAFGEQYILGRGEDTLLGQAIFSAKGLALDIDMHVFHDTFHDFPRVPDVRRKRERDRFHRACLGWIGRNPFLTWYQAQTGRLEINFETAIARQREGLKIGGPKAARFLQDARFESLAAALEASLAALPKMIVRYERLAAGWQALLDCLTSDGEAFASTGKDDGQVPRVA